MQIGRVFCIVLEENEFLYVKLGRYIVSPLLKKIVCMEKCMFYSTSLITMCVVMTSPKGPDDERLLKICLN